MAREEVDNVIQSLRDDEGLTFEAIAARIGVTKKSVQVRYYKLADSDKERISKASALHDRGLALEAIARELGVHAVTVAHWTGCRLDRGQSGNSEVQNRVVELVNRDGISIAAAARYLGLSKSVAWNSYRRALGGATSLSNRIDRADMKTRSIIELRDRHQLSWRAIASRVGMSATGARKRYYANADPSFKPSAPVGHLHVSRQRSQQSIVVSLRDEGMSFASIANEIGRTTSSVRALYYSAADADVERISRARILHGIGLAPCEIAGQLRVHEATVARWIGERRPGRRPQAELNGRVVQMRDEAQMEFIAIARELGISQANVRRRYRTAVDKQIGRIAEVRALYVEGHTVAEIAHRIGAHEETIRRWTASRPVRGRPPLAGISDEAIRSMRDVQGLTFRAISDSTGLSESTVWRRYKHIDEAVPASAASAVIGGAKL